MSRTVSSDRSEAPHLGAERSRNRDVARTFLPVVLGAALYAALVLFLVR